MFFFACGHSWGYWAKWPKLNLCLSSSPAAAAATALITLITYFFKENYSRVQVLKQVIAICLVCHPLLGFKPGSLTTVRTKNWCSRPLGYGPAITKHFYYLYWLQFSSFFIWLLRLRLRLRLRLWWKTSHSFWLVGKLNPGIFLIINFELHIITFFL